MGRSRSVRGERTEHAQLFFRTLAGFDVRWHQKVNFSTFYGKLTFQCTRNGLQNHPFCPRSLQDTFIIYSSISRQHISRTYFTSNKNLENRNYGNLKIQKTRFTNRSPGRETHANLVTAKSGLGQGLTGVRKRLLKMTLKRTLKLQKTVWVISFPYQKNDDNLEAFCSRVLLPRRS